MLVYHGVRHWCRAVMRMEGPAFGRHLPKIYFFDVVNRTYVQGDYFGLKRSKEWQVIWLRDGDLK